MKVQKISILWKPAPMPSESGIYDAARFSGELWSEGSLVLVLPSSIFVKLIPPGELEADIWVLEEPVEADILTLDLQALSMVDRPEYQYLQHTLVINGQKTVIQWPEPRSHKGFTIELKAGLPLPLIIGGIAVGVGVIAIAMAVTKR